jgi:preprotein translocase subunit SecD
MTICHQQRNRFLYSSAVLALMAIFTTALSDARLSEEQARKFRFELRLASHEKVKGWESVPGPEPAKTIIWISPEAALTNVDVAKAWPQPNDDGFRVGVQLTEEGALKLARLTKLHIGEFVAVMLDGRVCSAPKIIGEITGGRAVIEANSLKRRPERSQRGSQCGNSCVDRLIPSLGTTLAG